MNAWLRYLIAVVVACHGLTYALFPFFAPAGFKAWRGRAWVLGGAVTGARLRALMMALHIAAGIATIACAAAIAAVPLAAGWWPPLAIAAGVLSLASFATFYDGQARFAVEEGAIGLALGLLLLASALAFPAAFD